MALVTQVMNYEKLTTWWRYWLQAGWLGGVLTKPDTWLVDFKELTLKELVWRKSTKFLDWKGTEIVSFDMKANVRMIYARYL